MAKQKINDPIKEETSSFIKIRNSIYLLIPSSMHQDSNFPFREESEDNESGVKLKMLNDRIVVEKI